jgi:hypothetical protein
MKDKVELFFKELPSKMLIKSWLDAISKDDCEPETYTFSLDALMAFISEMQDYLSANKLIDTRNESMEERKIRLKKQRIVMERSKRHGIWAIDCGAMDAMVRLLDDQLEIRRSRAAAVLNRLLSSIDDENKLKQLCKPFIFYGWQGSLPGDNVEDEKFDSATVPPAAVCRKRAW